MAAKGLDADRIPEGELQPRLRGRGTFVADLHVHSRFAMGCSPALTLPNLAQQAKRKGIDLLATGDFTHPGWSAELRAGLIDCGDGLFEHSGVRFVLGTEISCVFKQDGKGRRVHMLAMVSSWRAVERLDRGIGQVGPTRLRRPGHGPPLLRTGGHLGFERRSRGDSDPGTRLDSLVRALRIEVGLRRYRRLLRLGDAVRQGGRIGTLERSRDESFGATARFLARWCPSATPTRWTGSVARRRCFRPISHTRGCIGH